MRTTVLSDSTLFPIWVLKSEALYAFAALLLLAPLFYLAAELEVRLANKFAQSLENRFARAFLPEGSRPDGIIVLGGSSTRVYAALDLAKRFPGTPIVLSGPGDREVSIARRKISDGNRLIIDRRATTTYENALFSKDLIAPRSQQCWVVVTSAVHMPRAVGAFQSVDFPILPWPVNDTPQTPSGLSAWVWHEVFGLIGYWAFGRSSDLYPTSTGSCV